MSDRIEIGPSEVHVWVVKLDGSPPAMDALAEDERDRARQFRLDDLRRRFVAARSALRAILGRYLDVPPRDVTFKYDAFGKPRLGELGFQNSDCKVKPDTHQTAIRDPQSSIHFNLAHSHELALVAITTNCPVGIDVERLRPVKHLDQLAHRYFHPEEVRAISVLDSPQRTRAFFECWTRKEAVLKAIGTGVQYPLEAFCVPLTASPTEWIEIPVWRSVMETQVWLSAIEPASDYVAAVACQEARPNVIGLEFSTD